MSDTQILIEVVEKAREDLTRAQTIADNTKRPENACAAHDCQFALAKALSHGIDTLLMLKLEEMRSGVPPSTNVSPSHVSAGWGTFVAGLSATASALRPVAWPLAIVCFSPNAVELVRLVIAAFAKQ